MRSQSKKSTKEEREGKKAPLKEIYHHYTGAKTMTSLEMAPGTLCVCNIGLGKLASTPKA